MKRLILIPILLLVLASAAAAEAPAQEKWTGIDEAIIQKYATDKGRPAAEPLFNVEGDMLLFLFALAGAIGGFVMGYQWHKVFVVGRQGTEKDD